MGNVYLLGPDSDIWETPNHSDLFSVNATRHDSLLSRLVTVLAVDWFHRLGGRKLRVRTLLNLVASYCSIVDVLGRSPKTKKTFQTQCYILK